MPRGDGRDVPVFTVELGLQNSELKPVPVEVSTPKKAPRRISRSSRPGSPSLVAAPAPAKSAKPPVPVPRAPSPQRRPPSGRRSRATALQSPFSVSARTLVEAEKDKSQEPYGGKQAETCRGCGAVFTEDSVFCRICGRRRDTRGDGYVAFTIQSDNKAAESRSETARTRSPTRSPGPSRRNCTRAVTVLGLHGKPPSMLERSEAWQKYRDEKLQALRDKCQADIGSFSPRLYRPVRSPRWLAGPEGGGGLFERGMRSIARRALEKRRHEEAQLESELLLCPFTPKLSPWSPSPDSRQSSATASPSPKRKPLRAAVSSLACDERPDPEGHVTPEQAKEFYQKQQAWFQAKQEEQDELRKEHIFRTLQQEAEARKCDTPQGETGAKANGVLPRTVYDRQIAWLRQRDAELTEQRRAQFEATTCRDSFSSGNETPRKKRPMSAPVTPQRKLEAPTASGTGAALLAKLRGARYLDDPTTPPLRRASPEPRGLWSRPPRRRLPARPGMVACTTCSRPCPVDLLHCKHCGQKRLKVPVATPNLGGLDYTADFGWPQNSEASCK